MGRLLSAVFVCLGFGAFFSVAYANHSWGSYHWARTANPFELALGDNVSSAWDKYLATASSDWGWIQPALPTVAAFFSGWQNP